MRMATSRLTLSSGFRKHAKKIDSCGKTDNSGLSLFFQVDSKDSGRDSCLDGEEALSGRTSNPFPCLLNNLARPSAMA